MPPVVAAIVRGALILTPVLALASPSSISVCLSGLVFALIISLLWRIDEPPILLLPVLFQWSEVAALPLATIWKQVPLTDLQQYSAPLDVSAAFGLAGITMLAVGLRLGSARLSRVSLTQRMQIDARVWSLNDVLRIGLSAVALGYFLALLAAFAGPARELANNAAGIKYVGIFLIAYWCLSNRRNYRLLSGITMLEVVFGMTGFFADFKNSLLTLLVAVMASRSRFRFVDLLQLTSTATLLLLAAVFWTSIKVDYRSFVNAGTGAQIVTVPLVDRIAFHGRALTEFDMAKLSEGFDKLVLRHGYIEYLALVMQNVPSAVPHEDGKLTLAVISHITMPRLLFPNKPPLPSDTDVMKRYTGLSFNWDENTSISIGNLGELYVDFGVIGALVAQLILGLIVALVYRWIRDFLSCPPLLTAGLCMMVALPVAYFGTAYVKLIGSFVFTSVIALSAQRYVVPLLGLSHNKSLRRSPPAPR